MSLQVNLAGGCARTHENKYQVHVQNQCLHDKICETLKRFSPALTPDEV